MTGSQAFMKRRESSCRQMALWLRAERNPGRCNRSFDPPRKGLGSPGGAREVDHFLAVMQLERKLRSFRSVVLFNTYRDPAQASGTSPGSH